MSGQRLTLIANAFDTEKVAQGGKEENEYLRRKDEKPCRTSHTRTKRKKTLLAMAENSPKKAKSR